MPDTVVDYASGPPSAAAIKAAGHIGAVRYLSPPRPGTESWMTGKPVHRAELDDFDANGLKMAMVWQFGKDDDADVKRGYDGGVEDAKAAQAQLDAIQASGHPVIFAVDYNIQLHEWNSYGVEYFRGAASVLGKQRVGVYGHSRLCHWAGPEDDVVAQVAPGRWFCWVTKAWSNGHTGSDYAVLYQRVVDTADNPGPVIDGVTVDVNDVLFPEWGWRSFDEYQQSMPRQTVDWSKIDTDIKPNPNHRGDPTFLADVLRAFGVTVEEMPGYLQWGMGDFDKIWGVSVHHTGANNTSAEYIARNAGLGGGLSSQIHLSRTAPYVATLCGVGIAWHMGKGSYPGLPTNNANPLLIGIEPQSNGTDPWPEGMLDTYYRVVAAILWYLGLDSSRVISHWEYSLIAQGKWDPGSGRGVSGEVMDMDHFRARVQHYIDNPPFLEGISTMALDLNKRYKSRYPGSPYEGTLVDFWINTDSHAFAARVNTEKIIEALQKQHQERAAIDLELADSISALAAAIRGQ